MITKEVNVSQRVLVTVDETKFTPQFMEHFRRIMYDFYTIDQHIEHLAQLWTRNIVSENGSFIEGYGNARDMGIRFETERASTETEIV